MAVSAAPTLRLASFAEGFSSGKPAFADGAGALASPVHDSRRLFARQLLWNVDVCSSLNSGHFTIHLRCPLSANNGSGHLVATVDDTLRADPLAREYQVVDSVHAWFSVGGQSPKIRAGGGARP